MGGLRKEMRRQKSIKIKKSSMKNCFANIESWLSRKQAGRKNQSRKKAEFGDGLKDCLRVKLVRKKIKRKKYLRN